VQLLIARAQIRSPFGGKYSGTALIIIPKGRRADWFRLLSSANCNYLSGGDVLVQYASRRARSTVCWSLGGARYRVTTDVGCQHELHDVPVHRRSVFFFTYGYLRWSLMIAHPVICCLCF